MIIFDKSLTLPEILNEYGKEMLKDHAYAFGYTGLSKLKKAELIRLIADRMLDPNEMFYSAAIMSDQEIDVFERGFNGPVFYSEEEDNAVDVLNGKGLIAVSGNRFVVPCDVVRVWKQIKNKEFDAYHKKASWVWKCLYWTEKMYAITPLEIMQQVVNVKKGMKLTQAEIIELFDHFPQDLLWTDRVQDIFVNLVYSDGDVSLEELSREQAGKGFYIPTEAEIEELYETSALISGKEYRALKTALISEFGMDTDEADALLEAIWESVSDDDDPNGTLQWFLEELDIKNDRQVNKILELYSSAVNGTRMLVNRGHTPSEIFAMSKPAPGQMPRIIAGSSQAAKMLREAAPEIRKMGFDLDLESNAATVPVMGFPDGIIGQAVVTEKKVYPNDPCPCGSGKKYKKCCGKGN